MQIGEHINCLMRTIAYCGKVKGHCTPGVVEIYVKLHRTHDQERIKFSIHLLTQLYNFSEVYHALESFNT